MKFLDICAGIGGFRSGLEKAGHECIGYVEIDKYARKSYEEMYDTKGEWTAFDVRNVRPEEIPKSDIWCFGFPCQDISVAGKQKGLAGERSGIFYDILKLLKSKRTEDKPKWLLIENVKNLLSIDKGEGFTEVLFEISEAGYDAEWHLINSKDYGVPQNRERVFIIGYLRGESGREILPITGTSGQASGKRQTKQQTCQRKSESKRQEKYGERFKHMIGNRKYQNSHVYGTTGVSRACDTSNQIYYAIPKQIISGDQAHRVYDSNGTSVTIKAEGGGVGAKTGLYAVPKIKTVATGTNQRKNVQAYNGISRTLTATDYKEPQTIAIPKVKSINQPLHNGNYVQAIDGLSRSVLARDYKDPQRVAIPCLTPDRINKRQNGRRFKEPNDPMFTLTAQDRHGVLIGKKFSDKRNNCIHSWDFGLKGECSNDEKKLMQLILDHRRHKEFGEKDGNPLSLEQIKTFAHFDNLERLLEHLTEMGYLKKKDDKYDISFGQLSFEVNDIVDVEKPISTLTSTDCNRHGVLVYKNDEYNIRRLTPKECFRLQGFTDEQFEKAEAVNSNTQLYKQAGNAVTVNVTYMIGVVLKEKEEI